MFGDGWDILAFCGLTLTIVGDFIGVHRVSTESLQSPDRVSTEPRQSLHRVPTESRQSLHR
eukprot:1601059-Pyramimonas_sp.AAC.1